MRAAVLLLVLGFATPAHAACPGESEIFSCTVEGEPLRICHWKGALIYNFGPDEKPELSLSAPLESAAFTPWSGIGRYVTDSVAFANQGYTYQVWTSAERGPEATGGLEGGVTVHQGEDILTQLACEPGSVSQSLDTIYDLKRSIGQCWDMSSQQWTNICE